MKGTNANGLRQCTHMRVTEMIPQAQRQDLYLKESELQHQFLSYQPGKRKKGSCESNEWYYSFFPHEEQF